MKIRYVSMPHWPRLAWLATGEPGSELLTVRHGTWVETHEEWFCEAVWLGEFAAGDFDRTPVVAGTGARLRDGRMRFVGAGTNVDRLHSHVRDGTYALSNSLACLMAWLNAGPRLDYDGYVADFAAYRYAVLGEHTRSLPTTAGPIMLTYFADLVWNGAGFDVLEKPEDAHDFDDFETYKGILEDGIRGLAENALCAERQRAFRLLVPLSSGYDSPAVAALAKSVDDPSSFTFRTDREGLDDSGRQIAELLGLPCDVIDRDAWRTTTLAEVSFVACSASVGDLPFKGAEHLLEGTLMLNGLGADAIWDLKKVGKQPPELGDGALLGLLEFRLGVGFFQYPVPLLGIRRIDAIVAITRSEEMEPWDVGSSYSKPICRRIAEEAGVPRTAFGMTKKGVSDVPVRGRFLTPDSRADFLAWLDERRRQDAAGGLPSSASAHVVDGILTPIALAATALERRARDAGIPGTGQLARGAAWVRRRLKSPYHHHRYMVHWAMERAMERYQVPTS